MQTLLKIFVATRLNVVVSFVQTALKTKIGLNCLTNKKLVIDFLKLDKILKINKCILKPFYFYVEFQLTCLLENKKYILKSHHLILNENVERKKILNDSFFKTFVLNYPNDNKQNKQHMQTLFNNLFIDSENKQHNITLNPFTFYRNSYDFKKINKSQHAILKHISKNIMTAYHAMLKQQNNKTKKSIKSKSKKS